MDDADDNPARDNLFGRKERGMKEMISFGDLLDLIDKDRGSDEEVAIMDYDSEVMRAKVHWNGWKEFEDREVSSIEASRDTLLVWLEEGKEE